MESFALGEYLAHQLYPAVCTLMLCRLGSQTLGARPPASPLQVNSNMQLFFFLQDCLIIVSSGVCVDVSGLLLVCSGACLEGDPFVSDQKHLEKPAP